MKKDLVKKALAVLMAMVMTVTMNMSLKAYATEPEKEDITTSSTIETSTVGTMVSLTAVEGTNGATSDEGYTRLFDGKRTSNNFSKWCVEDFDNAYVIFSSTEAVYVDGYSFIIGNDSAGNAGRNPKSWTLYGCNDSTAGRNSGSWEVIHSVTDDTILRDINYAKYDYVFNSTNTKYQYFKLEITEIQDGTVMQLCELILSASPCEHVADGTGTVIAPTCTKPGYTIYHCTICDCDYKQDIVSAPGHIIVGYSCSECDAQGDFTVTGGTEYIDYTYIDGCLTILTETPITVANKNPNVTTANIIVVASDVSANITLAGVNIAANSSAFIIADNSKGNVTITLADGTENTLGASLIDCGGLVKTGGADSGTLTINGSGKLTAIGNWNAAGIGSLGNTNTANIIIESGTIIAHGGGTGAGIGSGYRGTATNIVIKGGSVTAIGGVRTANTSSGRINIGGAGIGGGAGGSATGIYIEGGSVLAMVQVTGAKPIGTGHSSAATGVAVTPKCGSESVYLFELDVDGTSEVVVNGNTCYPKKHNDENKLYLYLPSKTLDDPNEIEIGSRTEKYLYNRSSSEWIKVVDVPVVDTTEFTYDGTEKTYLIAESDDYTIQGNKQTNVGTYIVTVTLNGDCVWSDGTTNDKTYDFVINKAEVTVIAKSYNIKVGEDLPTYEYEVVGLVTGETLPVDVTIICNAVDSDTEGIYTIEVSGDGSSENYTFNYVYGTLSVTEKEVVEAPTFTYENGTEFTSSLKITLDCAIDGVIIYYTTDGSTPTMSSTMYTGEIIITETTTIKAIAVKDGMLDSQVITVTYIKQVVEDNGGNEGNDVNGDNTSPSEPDDDSTSSKPGEGIPGVDHFIPVVPDTDDKAFASVAINYLAMIFAAVASFLARIKRRSKTQ